MKHLRKSILTLLALTLFGGAGAWAQGPTTVFEVDFSSTPTATTGSMRINGSTIYSGTVKIHNNADQINIIMLGSYNYSANRYLPIKPETGSFQTGDTLLIAMCYNNSDTRTAAADIYAANGTTKLFTTAPGINGRTESGDPVVEKFVLEQDADSLLIGRSSSATTNTYVTTLKVLRPAAQEIELTKEGDNQWTLGQAPDYDLELQVEYYEAHALKNIPAGWQVMVNGEPQPLQGDSLMITETDTVTLIPDGNRRRVKSVTLEDEAPAVQTVTIGGITLDITGCTYWSDIIERNSSVLREFYGKVASDEGELKLSGDSVYISLPYDPALQSNYYWQPM